MMNLFSIQEFSMVDKSKSAQNSGTDAICNIKQEKYSLRPRSLRQKTEKGLELKKEILNQKSSESSEIEKPKQKPPPLSKYRRKTANARERNRMREINVAFETLRRVVPHISGSTTSGNEKLTKITTLRLAMKYIQALRQVLDNSNNHQSVFRPLNLANIMDEDTDLDVFLSDGESLHLNSDLNENFASPDHSLTSPFSELSNSENSPSYYENQDFSIHDSVISSDFCLDSRLSASELCDDFLNGHCIEGLT